jgi:hypothetical protein
MIGSRTAGLAPIFTAPAVIPERIEIDPRPNMPTAAIETAARYNERPAWSRGEGMYKSGLAGAGQRFGDWLRAPGTAAMLFRSGAATLSDGLGAGLAAGAGYADQQKAQATAAAQQDFQNQMAILRQQVDQQQADQTGTYQRGSLLNDALRIDETGRSNRVREGLDANGQRIQLYGIDTSAATARRGQDVQVQNNAADNAQSNTNSQRSYDAQIHGDNTQAFVAGIGSKAKENNQAYTETQTKQKGQAGGWWSNATPEVVTTTRIPTPTAQAAPAGRLMPGFIDPQSGMTFLGGNPNARASWR